MPRQATASFLYALPSTIPAADSTSVRRKSYIRKPVVRPELHRLVAQQGSTNFNRGQAGPKRAIDHSPKTLILTGHIPAHPPPPFSSYYSPQAVSRWPFGGQASSRKRALLHTRRRLSVGKETSSTIAQSSLASTARTKGPAQCAELLANQPHLDCPPFCPRPSNLQRHHFLKLWPADEEMVHHTSKGQAKFQR